MFLFASVYKDPNYVEVICYKSVHRFWVFFFQKHMNAV